MGEVEAGISTLDRLPVLQDCEAHKFPRHLTEEANMRVTPTVLAFWVSSIVVASLQGSDSPSGPKFNRKTDLISLHYDHAPDKDDGHSAAADRMPAKRLDRPVVPEDTE